MRHFEDNDYDRIEKLQEYDRLQPTLVILDKLHYIQDNSCIYNIHYCNAGVGITYYEGDDASIHDWRKGLVTHKYYETFEKMIEAEYDRLTDLAIEDKSTVRAG